MHARIAASLTESNRVCDAAGAHAATPPTTQPPRPDPTIGGGPLRRRVGSSSGQAARRCTLGCPNPLTAPFPRKSVGAHTRASRHHDTRAVSGSGGGQRKRPARRRRSPSLWGARGSSGAGGHGAALVSSYDANRARMTRICTRTTRGRHARTVTSSGRRTAASRRRCAQSQSRRRPPSARTRRGHHGAGSRFGFRRCAGRVEAAAATRRRRRSLPTV